MAPDDKIRYGLSMTFTARFRSLAAARKKQAGRCAMKTRAQGRRAASRAGPAGKEHQERQRLEAQLTALPDGSFTTGWHCRHRRFVGGRGFPGLAAKAVARNGEWRWRSTPGLDCEQPVISSTHISRHSIPRPERSGRSGRCSRIHHVTAWSAESRSAAADSDAPLIQFKQPQPGGIRAFLGRRGQQDWRGQLAVVSATAGLDTARQRFPSVQALDDAGLASPFLQAVTGSPLICIWRGHRAYDSSGWACRAQQGVILVSNSGSGTAA